MSNIFNPNNCIQWWCLLALMFLSFLLGWLLSRYFTKKSIQEELDNCYAENKRLKSNAPKHQKQHAKTTFKKEGVKAVKTMERSGIAAKTKRSASKPKRKTKPTPAKATKGKETNTKGLNFANFGSATEANKDNLKRISGIGPFIENKLNTIGIYTFEQISKFTDTDIQQVTDLIAFFPGRILRDDWRGQAKILKEGKQTNFSKRVDNKDINYDKKS